MALTDCPTYRNTPSSRVSPRLVGHFVAVFIGLGFLAGCTTTKRSDTTTLPSFPNASTFGYREIAAPGLSCVPYARQESGLSLRGDAYTWWSSAAGTYERGQVPRPGAVLVLSKTSRLQSGHVAVVSQVLGPRQILVEHANWIPGRVIVNMPVIDISESNDWTALRFWYQPAQTYGDTYAAMGFIYGAATPPAVSARGDPLATAASAPGATPSADGTIVISGSGVSVSP